MAKSKISRYYCKAKRDLLLRSREHVVNRRGKMSGKGEISSKGASEEAFFKHINI